MAVSPAIDFVTVKGFKSIASLKVDLRPINVLIGANGSGKSNFVAVFSFLNEIRKGQEQNYVRKAGGAEQLLHFGSKVSNEIEIHLSIGQGRHEYSITLKKPTQKKPTKEYSITLKPTEDDNLYRAREGAKIEDDAPLLGRWHISHFNDTSPSSPIRKTAQVNDNAFLRPDGSNLPAFLYLLQQKYSESYKLIRGAVRRVAPFFDDFLLRPDPLNEETIRLAWKHKNSEQYFGASALSDGSLRFIVLAAMFLQPDGFLPSVIIVDEPELGLHPYAIDLLSSLVKQASVKTQVILSTQSSPLLDHFEPEDVIVAERLHGATQLKRLESSQLESWLEDYSLGQLWEKNELGGRPGQE
jgi:predicted ATPase